jgi:hypothetical protein
MSLKHQMQRIFGGKRALTPSKLQFPKNSTVSVSVPRVDFFKTKFLLPVLMTHTPTSTKKRASKGPGQDRSALW